MSYLHIIGPMSMMDAHFMFREGFATFLRKLVAILVRSRDVVVLLLNWYRTFSKSVDKHWRQR